MYESRPRTPISSLLDRRNTRWRHFSDSSIVSASFGVLIILSENYVSKWHLTDQKDEKGGDSYHKSVPFRGHIRKMHVTWSYCTRQKLYVEVELVLVHFLVRIRAADTSHRYLEENFDLFTLRKIDSPIAYKPMTIPIPSVTMLPSIPESIPHRLFPDFPISVARSSWESFEQKFMTVKTLWLTSCICLLNKNF